MKENTYFQICVYFCICIIVFTMCINLVGSMGVFNTESVPQSFATQNNSSAYFGSLANVSNETSSGLGIDDLFIVVLTGAGLGTIVLAWITRSPVIIGVYVFSAVFWASYVSAIDILSGWSYMSQYAVLGGFFMIITTALLFVWGGAVAGMLSGSG